MAKLFANSEKPDQTPRTEASDLGLHCLPITILGVSQLQWVKTHPHYMIPMKCQVLFSLKKKRYNSSATIATIVPSATIATIMPSAVWFKRNPTMKLGVGGRVLKYPGPSCSKRR